MSEQITVSREKLIAIISGLSGGYPNPDDPGPPLPWWPWGKPVVPHGPWPEPWQGKLDQRLFDTIGLENVALNPKALPLEVDIAISLAQGIVDHVAGLYDMAAVLPVEAGEQVLKVAHSRLAEFDDFCGTDRWFIWREKLAEWLRRRLRHPIPPPPDPRWSESALLAVIGTQLLTSAAQMRHEGLRGDLTTVGNKLLDRSLA